MVNKHTRARETQFELARQWNRIEAENFQKTRLPHRVCVHPSPTLVLLISQPNLTNGYALESSQCIDHEYIT